MENHRHLFDIQHRGLSKTAQASHNSIEGSNNPAGMAVPMNAKVRGGRQESSYPCDRNRTDLVALIGAVHRSGLAGALLAEAD